MGFNCFKATKPLSPHKFLVLIRLTPEERLVLPFTIDKVNHQNKYNKLHLFGIFLNFFGNALWLQ